MLGAYGGNACLPIGCFDSCTFLWDHDFFNRINKISKPTHYSHLLSVAERICDFVWVLPPENVSMTLEKCVNGVSLQKTKKTHFFFISQMFALISLSRETWISCVYPHNFFHCCAGNCSSHSVEKNRWKWDTALLFMMFFFVLVLVLRSVLIPNLHVFIHSILFARH